MEDAAACEEHVWILPQVAVSFLTCDDISESDHPVTVRLRENIV